MPVDTLHEDYRSRVPDWEMIRDGLDGERVVKARRQRYLPPPPGMEIAGNEVLASTGKRTTQQPYTFYLSFAEFPEIVEPALTGFQGIVHAREPMVSLPRDLEYLIDDATPEGDSLHVLWQAVTREILAGSRVGLLADVSRDDKIRFVTYSVENISNWQERPARLGGGAQFVVLRDIRSVRVTNDDGTEDEFATERQLFWRELRLNQIGGTDDEPRFVYQTRLWKDPDTGVRRTAAQNAVDHILASGTGSQGSPEVVLVDGEEWVTIELLGKPFDFIPFVSINALDIGFTYGAIPILPMMRRAFSIYRLTADYRRALYMKGDPQPYVSGIPKEEAPTRIGGETTWTFSSPDATPGYLDISGDGIPLMKAEIESQLVRFDQEGGRLLSTTQRAESGSALKLRTQAHQVTLRNVVINAGIGMVNALKVIAEMLGANPDEVVFHPDLDFAEPAMTGREATEWASAKRQGFPISDETLHSLARRGGVTEKTYEEELEQIDSEGAELAMIPRVGGESPDEPPPDPGDEESSEPEAGQEDGSETEAA